MATSKVSRIKAESISVPQTREHADRDLLRIGELQQIDDHDGFRASLRMKYEREHIRAQQIRGNGEAQ